MAPGLGEVDELSASVVLTSGLRTQTLSINLTDEQSAEKAGPDGSMDFDSTDSGGPVVEVMTYMEGRCPFQMKINILVRLLNGQNRSFKMSPKDYVSDLKDKISDSGDCPHQRYYWLDYQGKPLVDSHNLAYYHLQDNSQVKMMGRCKGG